MKLDSDWKRDEALNFLADHGTGVLATISPEGTPRARLVYYTFDDAFCVYFITLASTRKVADLAGNIHAAFVVSETDTPRMLQLQGTVEDLTDTATTDPILTNLVHTVMSNETYGPPLERFDSTALKFYRLTPDWIRWGDFTNGYGSEAVLTEINPTRISDSSS